ncbi:MAG: zinc ribbon domain-containing protein [Deltaproteobacteria bacterium]|nr:zinc ribbon domain-containing protein [Deltaproteobacteria bacterium]
MPIYEYQSLDPRKSCPKCIKSFEILQGMGERPLSSCPNCGNRVKKIISLCRSAVLETPEDTLRVEKRIREYEHEGMWSHAAELADKHSEKTKDKNLKLRALDNYKKAGYDTDSLAKHADSNND